MEKFRLFSTTQYCINYSASVGGVWLYKGEWEPSKNKALLAP